MISTNKHIIQKINIDVEIPNLTRGFYYKDYLDDFFKTEIFPELEYILNEANHFDQYSQIEHILIDIQECDDDLSVLKTKLLKQFLFQLQIQSKQNSRPDSKNSQNFKKPPISKTQRQWQAFIYFLETGQKIWYLAKDETLQVIQLIEYIQGNTIKKDLINVLSNESNLKRLHWQYFDKPVLLWSITHAITGKKTGPFPIFKTPEQSVELAVLIIRFTLSRKQNSFIQNLNELFKRAAVKKQIIRDQKAGQRVIQTLNKVLSLDLELTIDTKSQLYVKAKDLSDKESLTHIHTLSDLETLASDKPHELFCKHVGLVLLHPFLKLYFKKIGLLNKDHKLLDDKKEYAIHLLHYLATGNKKPFEYDLIFEKILCGLPLTMPVQKDITLLESDKNEGLMLLESVIEHWAALKKTSVEGLRQEFLQRAGKLMIQPDKIKLVVARKTLDILLQKLPWSVGVIQLPWIKKMIYVTW